MGTANSASRPSPCCMGSSPKLPRTTLTNPGLFSMGSSTTMGRVGAIYTLRRRKIGSIAQRYGRTRRSSLRQVKRVACARPGRAIVNSNCAARVGCEEFKGRESSGRTRGTRGGRRRPRLEPWFLHGFFSSTTPPGAPAGRGRAWGSGKGKPFGHARVGAWRSIWAWLSPSR